MEKIPIKIGMTKQSTVFINYNHIIIFYIKIPNGVFVGLFTLFEPLPLSSEYFGFLLSSFYPLSHTLSSTSKYTDK